ncbi:hypothetical protein J2S43_000175 [Catenuloplanes nepalensis]|uniref:Maltokinase N-terminal cap domain-containing protein n=1 Tax=Catenuloplanes nepalensis TaxID=587533 RepID=A0ABT9MJR3_9ACTN|nr:hypothetical protein [Catenuloplanes nepalensis]MDP9791663.1 hypothetical protein [Catenuloplanes nepalensis]
MAILHKARLVPTKLDLLDVWLPGRSWYAGSKDPGAERVAAFRFDDPAGAVGIETLLVRHRADGVVHQVPLTYREAPLAGADDHLLGTLEHSVLGTRWVYDAAGDPVYATALAHAILTGAGQADEMLEGVRRPSDCRARGTGTASQAPAVNTRPVAKDGDPTVITAGGLTLTVVRVVETSGAVPWWAEGLERLEAETGGVPFTLASAHI